MGRNLQSLIAASPARFTPRALWVADASSMLGQPSMIDGQVYRAVDSSVERAQVCVDFSVPQAMVRLIDHCIERGIPLVSGTTGLSATQQTRLRQAAERIPVIWAANFSVGICVLERLVAQAARALGTAWDAEIVDLHHRYKKDAPSGTALALGRQIAAARGQIAAQVECLARAGADAPRIGSEIGHSAVRGGDVVGEHSVFLFGDGERLELTHRANDRGIFASGALHAAEWLSGRAPGWYSLADCLGLAEV